MKKTDIVLIIVILALSISLYFILYRGPAEETRVNIYVDGELVRSEGLAETMSPIVVESSYGCNIIEIDSNAAEVTWSDCSSQVCVRTGKISRPGEVIVCLPHRLLITITGSRGADGEEGVDAITG